MNAQTCLVEFNHADIMSADIRSSPPYWRKGVLCVSCVHNAASGETFSLLTFGVTSTVQALLSTVLVFKCHHNSLSITWMKRKKITMSVVDSAGWMNLSLLSDGVANFRCTWTCAAGFALNSLHCLTISWTELESEPPRWIFLVSLSDPSLWSDSLY